MYNNESILNLRHKKGLTQTEFGEYFGVQQPMISDLERGMIRLTPNMAARIAKAFKVTAKSLLGE